MMVLESIGLGLRGNMVESCCAASVEACALHHGVQKEEAQNVAAANPLTRVNGVEDLLRLPSAVQQQNSSNVVGRLRNQDT